MNVSFKWWSLLSGYILTVQIAFILSYYRTYCMHVTVDSRLIISFYPLFKLKVSLMVVTKNFITQYLKFLSCFQCHLFLAELICMLAYK